MEEPNQRLATASHQSVGSSGLDGAFLKSIAMIGNVVNSRISELSKMTSTSVQKAAEEDMKLGLWSSGSAQPLPSFVEDK